jgi:hypothetical protein
LPSATGVKCHKQKNVRPAIDPRGNTVERELGRDFLADAVFYRRMSHCILCEVYDVEQA